MHFGDQEPGAPVHYDIRGSPRPLRRVRGPPSISTKRGLHPIRRARRAPTISTIKELQSTSTIKKPFIHFGEQGGPINFLWWSQLFWWAGLPCYRFTAYTKIVLDPSGKNYPDLRGGPGARGPRASARVPDRPVCPCSSGALCNANCA